MSEQFNFAQKRGPENIDSKIIEFIIKLAKAPNLSDQESICAIADQLIALKGAREFPHIISRLEAMKIGVEAFDEAAKKRMDQGMDKALEQIK